MHLSVIVPTRNRASTLEGALRSVTIQSFPQDLFEVIIIDNGSRDHTKSVYESFKERIANLRYFYDERPGLHIGRHVGLSASKSDILVYADDDIEALPTWLEGIANSFEDSTVALVGGKNLPKFETEPPDWITQMWRGCAKIDRMVGYLSILDLGDQQREVDAHYVFGCNFSIRKEILIRAQGFHPDAMPEELILYRGDGETHVSQYVSHMGYKSLYNPKASVFHLVPRSRMTIEYFCRRAFLQGISDSYTWQRGGFRREHTNGSAANLSVLIRKLLNFCKTIISKRNPYSKTMQTYYNKGFGFHQVEARKTPSLLEWIHKENYFGDNGTV